MSDFNQINTALERLFVDEGHRIVFWNYPDREFQNTLPFIMLEGVTTLRLDEDRPPIGPVAFDQPDVGSPAIGDRLGRQFFATFGRLVAETQPPWHSAEVA
jgi:hypothetical protein